MSRQDANAAFALSSFLQGTNAAYIDDLYARYEKDANSVDAEWQEFFVEAVTDFIVHQEKPRGYISQENADWLMRAISDDAMVTSMVELELLVAVTVTLPTGRAVTVPALKGVPSGGPLS